jgi:hypothetical protein
MFWAVEGMAAEFSTGILADRHIRRSGSRYAMLVVAILPMFTGLFVVLPMLGHATWHLYRRVVGEEAKN